MRADEKFTLYEGYSLLTLTFMYHVFNEVLPFVVEMAGTAAWIAQILSALGALVLMGLIHLLMKLYPNKDMLQVCDEVYGKYVGKAVQTVILLFLFFYCAVNLNKCVELLQIYAYSEISALEIDLLLMGAVAVMAVYSIKGLGKTVSIFLPMIMITLIIILVLSYRQYDPKILSPIFGYGAESIVTSGLKMTSEYTGFFVLSIFYTTFGSAKTFKKSGLFAILSAFLFFLISSLCYLMTIPYTSAEKLKTGILSIAQGSRSSRFLQRLESIFIAVTVMSIVLLLAISFLAIKKTYCNIFRINKNHSKGVIIPLGLIVVCIARTMGNSTVFRTYVRTGIQNYSIVMVLAILLPTILIGFIRKKINGKRMMKAASMATILLLVAGLFSGCVHYREPDEEVYPIIMGYEPGEKEKFKISMKLMMGSEADGEDTRDSDSSAPPKDVIVMECPSFSEGVNLINAIIPKKVSLLHIKMLVISEEIAREDMDFITALVQYNEMKPTMGLIICRGSAYEYLSSEESILLDSLQLDMELVQDTPKETYFLTTIADFMYNYQSNYGEAVAMYGAVAQSEYGIGIEEDRDPADYLGYNPTDFSEGYLPGAIPIVGNNRMEIAGVAVFQYNRMVGSLNTKETQTMMFMNNTLRSGEFSVPDPYMPNEYYISLQIRRLQKVDVDSWFDDEGQVHMRIKAPLNINVGIAQNTEADYISNIEHRQVLSDYICAVFDERGNQLIKKLQEDFRSDALQLGRYVAKHFTTIQEWEEYNWLERFPEADIQVQFIFNL